MAFGFRLGRMKPKHAGRVLTFGDLIANFYRTYGRHKAKGILRLVLKAQFVKFCGPHRFILSRNKEKNAATQNIHSQSA
jgi:hypothetical protein